VCSRSYWDSARNPDAASADEKLELIRAGPWCFADELGTKALECDGKAQRTQRAGIYEMQARARSYRSSLSRCDRASVAPRLHPRGGGAESVVARRSHLPPTFCSATAPARWRTKIRCRAAVTSPANLLLRHRGGASAEQNPLSRSGRMSATVDAPTSDRRRAAVASRLCRPGCGPTATTASTSSSGQELYAFCECTTLPSRPR
jgi:hypothetical protein